MEREEFKKMMDKQMKEALKPNESTLDLEKDKEIIKKFKDSNPVILGSEEAIKETKNILSDEDVDTIIDTLSENVSEDIKHLREIKGSDNSYPYNTINKPELMEGEALMEINPITGEQKIIGTGVEAQPKAEVSVSNIVDGEDVNILDSATINEETIKKLDEMGMSEEDTLKLTNVIMRKVKGEKFSIYKELPQSVKNMVRSMCGSNNINQLQACSEIVIDQFISELKIEQEFIDFQDTLKKEMNIPDLMDMYGDYLKESMEVKLLEKANELDATEPEKAQLLREISAAYSDSYTLVRQLKVFYNNEKECRRLDKELKKYDRYCTDFNYKYKNSKFKINDIKLVAHTLDRLFNGEVSIATIKKFVILLCRITRNMDSSNVVEHSFMYYSVKNILSLDYIDINSELYITLKNNIKVILDLIEKKEVEESGRK